MKNKIKILVLLLITLQNSGQLYGQSQNSVNIKLSTQEGNVYLDGILAGSAKNGSVKIDAAPGWNAIDITSKGYLTKRFYAFLSDKGPHSLHFDLNKLPSPDTKDSVKPYNFGDEKKSPLQFVSSCKQISASTSGSQRGKLACKDLTLGAEIQSTGPHISNESALSNPAKKLLMEKFIDVTLGSYNENWRIIAERLHQLTGEQVEGFEAAAWAALFGGDCNRVSEIHEYLKVLAKYSPSVWLFQSVCFEINEKPKLAMSTIKEGMLERAVDTNSSASLYYHKARLEMPKSVDKAIATLNTCIQKYPWYQKCYLMASDLWLAKGNLKKHLNTKNRFLARSQRVIGPKIEQAIKLSSMKKYDDALLVLGELGFYQNSFSASWLKVLIEKSKFKSTKLSSVSKAMFSNVFAPKSAAKVLKVMEKSSNPELLEKALKILIRDLPKNPYYRWKLSGLFLKSGDCKKVITLKIPKYKMNPKHKAGLLEHKARCYESTRDYKSAEKSLKTMARLVPTEWRVHYQLGNVYFKNKEKFKAISAYREALSLKPPKSFISIMNGRLDEIGAKDPKQEK